MTGGADITASYRYKPDEQVDGYTAEGGQREDKQAENDL